MATDKPATRQQHYDADWLRHFAQHVREGRLASTGEPDAARMLEEIADRIVTVR